MWRGGGGREWEVYIHRRENHKSKQKNHTNENGVIHDIGKQIKQTPNLFRRGRGGEQHIEAGELSAAFAH